MAANANEAHRSRPPSLDSVGTGSVTARTASETWVSLLEDLRERMLDLEQRSRWTIEWALYRWASEQLPSAAIRIDGSEGLTGSAPARWRLLVYIDPESGALTLAILEGRAPLAAKNVVASMLASSDAEFVISSRAGARRCWLPGEVESGPTMWLRSGVDRLVDLALGRDTPAPDGPLARPLAMAMAPLGLLGA